MLKILVPARFTGSYRSAYRSMPVRTVFIHGNDNLFQKHGPFTIFGGCSDQSCGRIDQSDPGHLDITVLDDDATYIVEKFLFALAA